MSSAFRVGGLFARVTLVAWGWVVGRADASPASPALEVQDLRCEYRRDSLSVESLQPRLSWGLNSNARGQRQTAYLHSCFTSVGGWFYQGLAGITPDPAAPGFKHFFVRPGVVGDVNRVRANYDSIQGRIAVAWKKHENGRFTLDVMVPVGSTATVCMPARAADAIRESGRPAAGREDIKFLHQESGTAVVEVPSGRYRFEAAAVSHGQK